MSSGKIGRSDSSNPVPSTQTSSEKPKSSSLGSKLLNLFMKAFSGVTLSRIDPIAPAPIKAPRPLSQGSSTSVMTNKQVQNLVGEVKKTLSLSLDKKLYTISDKKSKADSTTKEANLSLKNLISQGFEKWEKLEREIDQKNQEINQMQEGEPKKKAILQLNNLKTQVKDNEKELNKHISAGKASAIVNKKISTPPNLTPLTQGAAKHVWLQENNKNDVYYIARKSFLLRKEGELKEEVRTSQKIRRSIASANFTKLTTFFNTIPLLQIHSSEIILKITKSYGSLEEFSKNIDSIKLDDRAKKLKLSDEIIDLLLTHKNTIKSIVKSSDYLAIDLEEAPQEEQINQHYTVKTTRAANDLESTILKPRAFEKKLDLIGGILEGMEELHFANYVHGDLKPENILVFVAKDDNGNETQKVKIADFGKAGVLKENETAMMMGNNRYAAPEGRLSQKSEVYSSALIMIRTLEEGLLKPTTNMLDTKEKVNPSPKSEHRRGIEKFLILNDSSPQTETSVLTGKAKVVVKNAHLAADSIFSSKPVINMAAQNVVHGYIDSLGKALKEDGQDANKIGPLINLLKQMTLSDPHLRPSIKEANSKFKSIFA